MACGTGEHSIRLAKKGYKVTGVDTNQEMLKIAKQKSKTTKFLKGKMQDFKSKTKFDAITCLFTAINYSKDYESLTKALKNFYKLLNKKGILIFDNGIVDKQDPKSLVPLMDSYVEKDLEIARISQWKVQTNETMNVTFLILIKNKGKVDFAIDKHQLGTFSNKKIKQIMADIGFKVKVYDKFTGKLEIKSKRAVFVGEK